MRLLLATLLLAPLAAAQPQVGASQPALVTEPAAGSPAAPFVGPGTVEYAYDDGTANVNTGPPSSFDPDMLWGNAYTTESGGEEIVEVAVAFGSTFPSVAGGVTFWLLDDPDGDFDPRTGATALASVTATPDVFGNTFYRVAFPPTRVSSHFFVGASARLLGGQDRPARVDTDGRADRSWFFYAPDIAAVIDTLSTAPFGTRMDNPEFVPFPGAFMVRAAGRPAGTTSSADDPSLAAPTLALAGAHPSRDIALRVTLPAAGDVRLDVTDALGRRVARLGGGAMPAGEHVVRWDASRVAAGVYVARLTAGGASRTLRIVVASP